MKSNINSTDNQDFSRVIAYMARNVCNNCNDIDSMLTTLMKLNLKLRQYLEDDRTQHPYHLTSRLFSNKSGHMHVQRKKLIEITHLIEQV